ncbi:MAG: hypothetical protein EBV27_00195 [Actinobacteria bacterium]|nr:hypothetical protein [Actinomycetota bacterium]
MTISKAHWDTSGDSVRLSLPFVVTAEASMKAFSAFRGNIREMHQPSAVGKMVSFKQDKYFDPNTKKFYNGVFVSAYVSKGAQDAWEKVLDGTYTGFSIGGRMNKWDDGYDEKSDSTIRIIKDYDLVELSLVDSPANQFANIMQVEKVDGVAVVKGQDVALENVFYDEESGIVMVSEEESVLSPTNGSPMKNIGFVEKNDNEKIDMVKFLVDSAKGINTSKINKEVNPMTEETTVVEETTEVTKSEEIAPEADAVVEAPVAEVAEKSDETPATEDVAKAEEATVAEEVAKSEETVAAETVEETSEVSKSDDVVAESIAEIKNTITSAFSDLVETVKSLQAEVEMLKSSKVDTDAVKNSLEAVAKDIAATNERFNEFGKRVDAVEADTAFRKSGDLGEIVQELQMEKSEKSLWGGRFLKTADL